MRVDGKAMRGAVNVSCSPDGRCVDGTGLYRIGVRRIYKLAVKSRGPMAVNLPGARDFYDGLSPHPPGALWPLNHRSPIKRGVMVHRRLCPEALSCAGLRFKLADRTARSTARGRRKLYMSDTWISIACKNI
ncbi:unnamed protein product, partial [Iphiclides podalirius]